MNQTQILKTNLNEQYVNYMNSDLNKEAQALEVNFQGKQNHITHRRKTKSYNSQTCFNNILRIYLNEKFNFYNHIMERNAYKTRKSVYQTNFFIDFKIY